MRSSEPEVMKYCIIIYVYIPRLYTDHVTADVQSHPAHRLRPSTSLGRSRDPVYYLVF